MPAAVEALQHIEDHQHYQVIKQPGVQAEVVQVVDQPHPQETVLAVLPIPEEVAVLVDMMIPTPMVRWAPGDRAW
jgi:hypothetical protein